MDGFRRVLFASSLPLIVAGCATHAAHCSPDYEAARAAAAAQALAFAHFLVDATIFFLHVFSHCH